MLHPHPISNLRDARDRLVVHRPIPVAAAPAGICAVPQNTAVYNMPSKLDVSNPANPGHWFHGSITREDTECLLRNNGYNGTFLIRYSTSTHKYVLSVIHSQQLYHYPIEELLDGFYQVNGTNAKYLGIDLLVSEFRRANNCIVCSLGKPIIGTKPPPHITVYGTTNELHHAVRKANLKFVRDLLNRVVTGGVAVTEYINEKSADSGATPLIEAAKTGSNDIVRLLLDQGALVNLRDCGGFTALHRACQKSFAHVAETLLRLGRSNPQIKCPFSGNTALHEAAMLGHADCVNCLLRFNAAPWARNAESEMPFELALRYGFAELAVALAGYQPAPPVTNQSDWFHPALSKSETERIFSTCFDIQDGAFLVRRSSLSERKFVLVIYYQRQTIKYQIEVVDFSFHSDTKEAYFIDKGPLHISLEHFIEHYSRFADGIPTRLRYAISPSGRVINIENLLSSGPDQRGRDSASKLSSCNQSGEWSCSKALASNSVSVVSRMGAPLILQSSAVSDKQNSQSIVNKPNSASSSSNCGVTSAATSTSLGFPSSAPTGHEIRLIPSDSVILLYRLGEGEFGEVYRGQLHLDNGNTEDVAVKVLVKPCQRLEFLKEASIMMHLSHENIIKIYGICENKRLMMILELAGLGSLLDFMLDYPERCQLSELYNWSMQIASGMTYLESNGFVHRDLACRNVLLVSQTCAKISDFGLSRAVGEESDYYKATQRGKWPVKWYAPESIYYKTFSHASDVWSFGVCLWEMFSLGEHPYADQDSFEVLRQLEEGIRLPRAKMATDEIHDIMLNCWAYNPEARPKFLKLLAIFKHLSTNVYENYTSADISTTIPSNSSAAPCACVPNESNGGNGPCHFRQEAPPVVSGVGRIFQPLPQSVADRFTVN